MTAKIKAKFRPGDVIEHSQTGTHFNILYIIDDRYYNEFKSYICFENQDEYRLISPSNTRGDKDLTILLDIDGVLNIRSQSYTTRGFELEHHLVSRLNYLIKELSNKYQVHIVLYSGWKYEDVARKCAKYPAIVSKLIDVHIVKRNPNQETFVSNINSILDKNNIPNDRVILIDDELWETKRDSNTLLHRIDNTVGISDSDVTSIIQNA